MILTSPLLGQFEWLEHGFGTRLANIDQTHHASLKQIHSAIPLRASAQGCAGEGDALLTAEQGTTVSIRTADCYPILIADQRLKAVAAVHAGWRGTADEIVIRTLDKMRDEFGTQPGDVYAVMGPGIGPCCYTVGEDVALRFGRKRAGPLDLGAVNRRQLLIAGVPGEQIDAVGSCTSCDADLFHSYRRDKDRAGRMVAYIGIR